MTGPGPYRLARAAGLLAGASLGIALAGRPRLAASVAAIAAAIAATALVWALRRKTAR